MPWPCRRKPGSGDGAQVGVLRSPGSVAQGTCAARNRMICGGLGRCCLRSAVPTRVARAAVRQIIRMVDYALNELMQPIYHAVRGSWPAVRLRPDLQRVADAGVACNGERIYLQSHAPARQGQAAAMDQFTAERWVNDVPLASVLPWSDPAWRPDVLAQGLRLARASCLSSLP
jgi:hypothetical protein